MNYVQFFVKLCQLLQKLKWCPPLPNTHTHTHTQHDHYISLLIFLFRTENGTNNCHIGRKRYKAYKDNFPISFYVTARYVADLQCLISISYNEMIKGTIELEFHIFCNVFVNLYTSLLLILHCRNTGFENYSHYSNGTAHKK
jgi:hypothetical protein